MMSVVPKRIIQEVVLSTKQNVWLVGNCVDYLLPEYIDFGTRDVKVGLKNVRFPRLKSSVKVKLIVKHFLEKIDESEIRPFQVDFFNFKDLCQQLEVIAFNSLGIESSGGLDFTSPPKTNCNHAKFILSFSYEDQRIVVRKNIDYIIYIGYELDELLQFGAGQKVDIHGNVFFKLPNSIHLSKYLSISAKENDIVHVAIYDLIESNTLAANGCKYPVICTFNRHDNTRASYDYLSIKTVAVSYVKRVKCCFFNEYFEPLVFNSVDLINDPLMFTFTFFEL